MAVASVDDIVAGLAQAQNLSLLKTFTAAKAAGAFQSGWLAAGQPGAGAAAPAYTAGAGYGCDNTTVGAAKLTNAAVQNWLAKLSVTGTQNGTLIIADRLWSCSGMGFAAGTYAVNAPGNLPARITDNGVGCELWIEQFVAAGAATGTLTANYLDAASGAARQGVIPAVVSAPVAGQIQPVPLAAGSNGISQLTSIVTSATWTSGSFGATIVKRLVEIPISANVGQMLDWAQLGLPQIPNGACLMFAWLASGTTAPVILGSASVIDK